MTKHSRGSGADAGSRPNEQEEFAASFSDTLADSAIAAGEIARGTAGLFDAAIAVR